MKRRHQRYAANWTFLGRKAAADRPERLNVLESFYLPATDVGVPVGPVDTLYFGVKGEEVMKS